MFYGSLWVSEEIFFVVGTERQFFSKVDRITSCHVTEKEIPWVVTEGCEAFIKKAFYKSFMLWLTWLLLEGNEWFCLTFFSVKIESCYWKSSDTLSFIMCSSYANIFLENHWFGLRRIFLSFFYLKEHISE